MRVAFVFSSQSTACFPVAAVPAVARAAREAALAGAASVVVVTPRIWQIDSRIGSEIKRLAPGVDVTLAAHVPHNINIALVGEAITPAPAIVAMRHEPAAATVLAPLDEHEALKLLRHRQREIFSSAGKPGDGIVSRLINRPLSKMITRAILRFGPLHPMYATLGTALIGIAMLAVLVAFPGYAGQVWGALLFHAASMFDGVDGEVSRITFRSSKLGATMDSLVDLSTNIGFFAGLIWNFHHSGSKHLAAVALVGLVALALGKVLLGLAATRKRQAVTFNAVKDHFAQNPSRLKLLLTWLTMRDFYAFAAVPLLIAELGEIGVYAFTVIVHGWLMVVIATLRSATRSTAQAADAQDRQSGRKRKTGGAGLIRHT